MAKRQFDTQALPELTTGETPPAGFVTLYAKSGQLYSKDDDGVESPLSMNPLGQSYTHSQGTASADWTIVHNLGFKPRYSAEDSAHNSVEGVPEWPDDNTLIIHFNSAFGGWAYLS